MGPLTELFSGASVVCNIVGPFVRHGPAVWRRASRPAAITWTRPASRTGPWPRSPAGATSSPSAACCSPGVAQMYTTGEIAANICLETPGVDTLDILVLWKGFPTQASTQTIFTILKADWYYLEHNQYQKWNPEAKFEVVVPGQHETGLALPWGGTCHPVWFKNDRGWHLKAIGSVFDRTVMEGVVATVKLVEEQIKTLPADQQEEALANVANSVQSGMPPREKPRVNTSLDSVYASGPLGRVHCVIHGNSNYKQTGLLQAYAAYSLQQQPPRRAGFASACQALGTVSCSAYCAASGW